MKTFTQVGQAIQFYVSDKLVTSIIVSYSNNFDGSMSFIVDGNEKVSSNDVVTYL
jgi:hypothetical protein